MVSIGLAGGIGSGKSTVGRLLVELGAIHIDGDKVGHEIYLRGTPGWQQVVSAFGDNILDSSMEVDRKKLSAIVFSDKKELNKLNAIVHPLIMNKIRQLVTKAGHEGAEVVIVEGAVLLEAGWANIFDEVWIVTAPEALVVERVRASKGAPVEETTARIHSQMSNEERKRFSLVVIENKGTIEELRAKVASEWLGLKRRHPAAFSS